MAIRSQRISLDRIERAALAIDPVFLDTPQYTCEPLCDALRINLKIKVETMNPVRCFKGRGADFFLSTLQPGQITLGIVCASAGNFGQAMAYSARKRGIKLTVYAAQNANPLKIARMKSLGAFVERYGDDFDMAKQEARRVADETGARFVEDGREPEITEGAGTIAMELLRIPERLEAVILPLGNGALLNGVAHYFKVKSPQTRIIAVQAAGAPAMVESWRADNLITHQTMNTICDGIGVRVPVQEALSDMRGVVDDAVLVSDEAALEAIRLLHKHAGLVAEPSGAVGIAALLEHHNMFKNLRVATVICGGNLTEEQTKKWL
jgi:threonine dehydratase